MTWEGEAISGTPVPLTAGGQADAEAASTRGDAPAAPAAPLEELFAEAFEKALAAGRDDLVAALIEGVAVAVGVPTLAERRAARDA